MIGSLKDHPRLNELDFGNDFLGGDKNQELAKTIIEFGKYYPRQIHMNFGNEFNFYL